MELGDRMKMYEQEGTSAKAMMRLPVLVRLDGKCFHKLTKKANCAKPFDASLHDAMVAVATDLAIETNAKAAYTQSDEITLLLYSDNPDAAVYFDGKYHKINSVLAGRAANVFNAYWQRLPRAIFDCRTWTVPTKEEAVNAFIWREQDAVRNSVQMAARSVYSHNECHQKNTGQLQEMLFQRGINWNDYRDWEKRGTYIIRRKKLRVLTEAERLVIPERHRPAPDFEVERTGYEEVTLPIFTKITNRVEVLFEGAEPILKLDGLEQARQDIKRILEAEAAASEAGKDIIVGESSGG